MEEQIKYKEEEIKSRKAHKFNRDKMDYEHGRIYTFARKYDTARTKDISKSGADCAVQHISADDSSEVESSADEIPRNKLDFQGEMRLMQWSRKTAGVAEEAEDEVEQEKEAINNRIRTQSYISQQIESFEYCCEYLS
ncbi:hypothetical protein NDU88_006124 [Pleurodeles waltl]|uniref:Uncharacterized protein n=1 Tax=Pleurodeles waltl TaxID=8319 RepID=A0AAV7NX80_PLEWA|nr:hypothetical protein NDU88_006124 [Pleurodeles waltl]